MYDENSASVLSAVLKGCISAGGRCKWDSEDEECKEDKCFNAKSKACNSVLWQVAGKTAQCECSDTQTSMACVADCGVQGSPTPSAVCALAGNNCHNDCSGCARESVDSLFISNGCKDSGYAMCPAKESKK